MEKCRPYGLLKRKSPVLDEIEALCRKKRYPEHPLGTDCLSGFFMKKPEKLKCIQIVFLYVHNGDALREDVS